MAVAEVRVLSTGSLPRWNGPGPRDVLAKAHAGMVGRFGKAEVEVSAFKIVSFLATFGPDWRSFTLRQAIGYYEAKGWDPDMLFFGLAGAWYDDAMVTGGYKQSQQYLALSNNGEYAVTSLFVEACMRE